MEAVHIAIREETTSHGSVYALVAVAVCQVGETGQGVNAHQMREKVQRSGASGRLQLPIPVQPGVQTALWYCSLGNASELAKIALLYPR